MALAVTLRRLRESPKAERAGLQPITLDPIKITHPRPRELPTDGQPTGSGCDRFPVRGTLKSKPAGHEVWQHCT
jgi:hypothetical protein